MALCLRIPLDLIFKWVEETKRKNPCWCGKESPDTAKHCSNCGKALDYEHNHWDVHEDWKEEYHYEPGRCCDPSSLSILGLDVLGNKPDRWAKYVDFKLEAYKSDETKNDCIEIEVEDGEIETYPINPFRPEELNLAMAARHAKLWMRDFEEHGIPRDQMQIVIA